MKIEFTQWLQEEIERIACNQVEEKMKVKYLSVTIVRI